MTNPQEQQIMETALSITARMQKLPTRPSEEAFIRGEPLAYHDFHGRRCVANRVTISGVPTLRIRVKGGKRAKEFFMPENEARSFYRNIDAKGA